MKMAKPVEVWNRPLPLGGTKQLQFTSTVDQVWDGSTATEFDAGTGKKEDPYIIKNGAQLAYAVKNNKEGEWYKQICDITLYVDRHGNAPDNPNPFHSLWIDSSWGKDVKWKAQYDGGSHFVKGAYVDTEGKGLFGDIDKGGAVANLGIIDSHARKGAGLFAGKMNGKITNCIAQGTVGSLHSFDDDYYLDYCGGICSLVGPDNSDAVVEDCISAVYTMMWSFADYTPFVCLSDNNKGVVKNNYGDIQFGHYLDEKKISGNLPVCEIKAETMPYKKKPHLIIETFSAPQLESDSGYWGGEVRLARYYDGKKYIPLTGFSIAGSLYEDLKSVGFSEEEAVQSRYKGPKYMIFKGIKIS